MICFYCRGVVDGFPPPPLDQANLAKVGNVPTEAFITKCGNCGAAYHVEIQLVKAPSVSPERLKEIRNVAS